jgi:hypothetical protein
MEKKYTCYDSVIREMKKGGASPATIETPSRESARRCICRKCFKLGVCEGPLLISGGFLAFDKGAA